MAKAATAAKKAGGRQEQPYNLAPEFERAAVYLACVEPRFMARTAHEVRPDLLGLPECRLALECALDVFVGTKRAPQNYATVIQAAARRCETGKITHEEVRAVAGLFDAYDGKVPPRIADVESELVTVVRGRLRHAIAQAAVDEHSADAEWTKVRELMTRETRLGVAEDEGLGARLNVDGIRDALERLRGQQLFLLGITPLDDAMHGVGTSTLTCFMAAAGGGKSMTLSHCMAQLSLTGRRGIYATLEVSADTVLARTLACQTGQRIKALTGREGDASRIAAERSAVDFIENSTSYIAPLVKYFTPNLTTVDMIETWLDEVEQEDGVPVDDLWVDYGDKLTSTGKFDEKGTYQEQRIVFEKLRIIGVNRKMRVFTATQSRGREEKKGKKLDIDQVSDSSHKPRICDVFIANTLNDDTKEMEFFIAKSRDDVGRFTVGPVPTFLEMGQVAPVERKHPSMPALTEAPF
jgi:hypothetical protein